MIEAERTLSELLNENAPPARDPAFVFEVMLKVERRRMLSRVAGLAPWAVAGAGVLWAAGPALAQTAQPLAPAVGALVVALGCTYVLLRPRLI